MQSLGNWVTVTEYGATKGVGSRRVRVVLSTMGLLAEEAEPRKNGSRIRYRRRLTAYAVEAGLGKRQYPSKKCSFPFDVLSPKGQLWCDQRWEAAVANLQQSDAQNPTVVQAKEHLSAFKLRRLCPDDFTLQQEVYWLLDHYPNLLNVEICQVTDGSKQVVSGYRKLKEDQIRRWEAKKSNPPV